MQPHQLYRLNELDPNCIYIFHTDNLILFNVRKNLFLNRATLTLISILRISSILQRVRFQKGYLIIEEKNSLLTVTTKIIQIKK